MEESIKTRTMDKPIKIGEFVMSLLIFLGAIVSGWVTVKTDLSNNNTRIGNLEDNYRRFDAKMDNNNDKVMTKLDFIQRELANKQDRKK